MKRNKMKEMILTACLACSMLTAAPLGAEAQESQTDTFTTQSGKELKITCIKHASIMMEYEGRTLYIDPVTTLTPTTDYTTLPKANYIIYTHDHPDHFDRMALGQLVTPNTVTYGNKAVGTHYYNAMQLSNGDSVSINSDIKLKAVPAYNITDDHKQFHPKGRDNGYVLTIDGLRIYIAGDTEDIPEMAELKDIDIAFLPCNQPYTMTLEQLVNAAKTIKPKVLFPYHFNDTPVSKLRLLLNGSGIDVRLRRYK